MKNKIQLFILVIISILIFIFRNNLLHPIEAVGNTTSTVLINEIVTNNESLLCDSEGNHYDYIELYNSGTEPVNLMGYGLSDEPTVPLKWTFPYLIIQPGQYLTVFAPGHKVETSSLHTNFKLDNSGEKLVLSNSKGKILQAVIFKQLLPDMCYGRAEDNSYVYFAKGTPNAENGLDIIDKHYLELADNSINFSQEAGFYSSNIHLEITSTSSELTIHYTTDGSKPTYLSPTYTSAIEIKDNTNSDNKNANQQLTYDFIAPPANTDVFKGTVITAQAFWGDKSIGDPVTKTYFVSSKGKNRYTLPVINLTTDPFNLYDDKTGIFVFGSAFRNIAPDYVDGGTAANYNQRGIEWERPVYMEYFENGELEYSQNLGMRTNGAYSRANPKKSLKLFARTSYSSSQSQMEYEFFQGLTDVNNEPITEFNHLLLRSGGNDWECTLLRDSFAQSLVSDVLDTQESKPVIVFINGEYWGIYYLNESIDTSYIEDHYAIAKEDVVLLGYSWGIQVEQGTGDDFSYYGDVERFAKMNDMTLDSSYDYVNSRLDISNFIAYFVSQIYFDNTDWPGNNCKLWRYRTDDYSPDAPEGQDGRWRYLLYDTDFGFGLYSENGSVSHNTLEFAATPQGDEWPNPPWSNVLFRKLLENERFKNEFINCMADYLNTRFSPSSALEKLEEFENEIAPEIDEYSKRYSMWQITGLDSWKSGLDVIKQFITYRPDFLRRYVKNYFSLSNQYNVNIEIKDFNEGNVLLNHHQLAFNDKITFDGVYFSGVPITLTAVPAEGYSFAGWTGDFESTDITITIDVDKNINIKPVFVKE